MKLLKKIFFIFIFFLLSLTTTIFWVIYTQSGLKFTINTIIKYYLPMLKIEEISGNFHCFNLKNIFYVKKNFFLKINELNVTLNLFCFKRFHLCLEKIFFKNVNIKTNSNTLFFNNQSKRLKKINVFYSLFPISIKKLIVKNFNAEYFKKKIFFLDLQTKINWKCGTFNIQKTNLNGLRLDLKKKHSKKKKDKTNFIYKIFKNSSNELFETKINCFFKKIFNFNSKINFYIKNFQGTNWFLTKKKIINQIQCDFFLQKKKIIFNNLFINTPKFELNFVGNINLNYLNSIYIKSKIMFHYKKHKQKKNQIFLKNLLNRLNYRLDLFDYFECNIKTKIIFLKKNINNYLKLKKNLFFQNNQKKKKYSYVKIMCKLEKINFFLNENNNMINKFPIFFILNLNYNNEEIVLKNSIVYLLTGKIKLNSLINWKKEINWRFDLEFLNITFFKNFYKFYKICNGKIFFSGKIYKDRWSIKILFFNINSKLNDTFLKINAEISRNIFEEWRISIFRLLNGINEIKLCGNIKKNFKINCLVNILNFKKIHPFINGCIKGNLKLIGNLRFPVLFSNVFIKNFKWKKIFLINEISFKNKVFLDKNFFWKIFFLFDKIKVKNLFFYDSKLIVKGNKKKQIIKINFNETKFKIDFLFYGSLDLRNKNWIGKLKKNCLKTLSGHWRLDKEIYLKYIHSEKKIKISSHCWLNSNKKICFNKKNDISKIGEINVSFQNIDLEIVKKYLPNNFHFFGNSFGYSKLIWNINNLLFQLKINVMYKNINLYHSSYISEIKPIKFKKIQFDININNEKILLNWLIYIFDKNKIFGSININYHTKKLFGRIKIINFPLKLIKQFLIKDEFISGKINGKLKFFGSIQKPLLYGDLFVSNIKIFNNYFKNEIKIGFIKINFLRKKISLIGMFYTKNGYLKLIGKITWKNIKFWKSKLFILGDKINITFPFKTKINIKPNIVVEGNKNYLKITGKILIHSGNIFFQKYPEFGINISKDEIILDKKVNFFKKKYKSIPIFTDLNIKIGSKVYLDIFGLKSKLKGQLKIKKNQSQYNLNGEINLLDGRFHQFGQDLILKNGQILFFSPTGQPFLNLEVIKNPENINDNVIATIKILGLINELKTTFFSTKIRSNKEELSYIFKGKNLINNLDFIMLFINIGLVKGEKIIDDFGKMIGISELILNTQGNGQKSQLILSGKIKKYLQIKYGIGIFNSNTTFSFRYYLFPKLYLETIFGIDKIFNLLYQLDF